MVRAQDLRQLPEPVRGQMHTTSRAMYDTPSSETGGASSARGEFATDEPLGIYWRNNGILYCGPDTILYGHIMDSDQIAQEARSEEGQKHMMEHRIDLQSRRGNGALPRIAIEPDRVYLAVIDQRGPWNWEVDTWYRNLSEPLRIAQAEFGPAQGSLRLRYQVSTSQFQGPLWSITAR